MDIFKAVESIVGEGKEVHADYRETVWLLVDKNAVGRWITIRESILAVGFSLICSSISDTEDGLNARYDWTYHKDGISVTLTKRYMKNPKKCLFSVKIKK